MNNRYTIATEGESIVVTFHEELGSVSYSLNLHDAMELGVDIARAVLKVANQRRNAKP